MVAAGQAASRQPHSACVTASRRSAEWARSSTAARSSFSASMHSALRPHVFTDTHQWSIAASVGGSRSGMEDGSDELSMLHASHIRRCAAAMASTTWPSAGATAREPPSAPVPADCCGRMMWWASFAVAGAHSSALGSADCFSPRSAVRLATACSSRVSVAVAFVRTSTLDHGGSPLYTCARERERERGSESASERRGARRARARARNDVAARITSTT